MFTADPAQIQNAIASSVPVYARQIGGVTWMRVLNDYRNFDLLEYWIGGDYPRMPGSVDPDYPMHMREKLRAVLNAAPQRPARIPPAGRLPAPEPSIPEGCQLIAHNTGDGWYLAVRNRAGADIAILAWPPQWPDKLTGANLQEHGFEIV